MDFESGRHDFLLLSYGNLDFLVDRFQFSASTSLDRMGSLKTPLKYIDHYSWFNGQRMLLFDLNQCLIDSYRCMESGTSRLCLIMRLEDFTDRSGQYLGNILGISEKISHQYLGMVVTSQAEIHPMSLSNIRLNPPGVHRLLKRKGLYGCCFTSGERVQFLIDLQKLFLLSLEESKNQLIKEKKLQKEGLPCL